MWNEVIVSFADPNSTFSMSRSVEVDGAVIPRLGVLGEYGKTVYERITSGVAKYSSVAAKATVFEQ